MRRGHSIGGWRNENSRHFTPRNGGPQQFRANRNYILHDPPRYPPRPPHHSFRESEYSGRPVLLSNPPDHYDRNRYRNDNRQKSPYRGHHQRSVFPTHDHSGHDTRSDDNRYPNDEHFHINSMGDVDHRQSNNYAKRHDSYNQRPPSQWSNPPDDNNKYYYEDRNRYKSYKHHEVVESNKIPNLEYSGHRPPASDHYGGNPSTTLDNSKTFSRSVDDTVDFIRKRLQNRGELNQSSEELRSDNSATEDHLTEPMSSNYHNIQQNQPAKKRMQKQSLNVEANCDKMKNKIVHQLFKMDKAKIHKLMDNPSSSSKFEYALSSLITESQNSLNRHLRSVAEKSLCSSEAFVHNDNNTIYEDTFMKQMQGILDPQDTVLLEDIKPLVLAELSKVLQLNEYDQPFQLLEDQGNLQSVTDQEAYNDCDYDNYSQNEDYYEPVQSPQTAFDDFDNPGNDSNDYTQETEETKPLFERRPAKQNVASNIERKLSSESQMRLLTSADTNPAVEDSVCNERRYSRQSLDNNPSEDINTTPPLFNTKTEQCSDDDDPFAELDKQYHVAVEPNFIDTYDISSPQQSSAATTNLNTRVENSDKSGTDCQAADIGKEIDSQLLTIAKSPLKLTTSNNSNHRKSEKRSNSFSNYQDKQEKHTVIKPDEHKLEGNHESTLEPSGFIDITANKPDNTPSKTPLSNSRKRSVDQKPSHRKEKRKKSDSIQPEPVKVAVLDVIDTPSKDSNSFSNSSAAKSNSKEIAKDTKKNESGDKCYSDKYVKRKETQNKKDNKAGQKTRQRSTSSSLSTVSPKDNSSNNNKVEPKNKLQTIDMFLEPSKKVNVHQAHRNTAQPPTLTPKVVEAAKPPALSPFNRKIIKRHVATQVIKKSHTKETQTIDCRNRNVSTKICQTIKKKTINSSAQTDPVTFEKSASTATDAFERMKEIDMEIQVLLQEKFKLYNSLESNAPGQSKMQTLGMTVLNVALPDPKDNNNTEIDSLTEDAIVEDFTNIPVEELEQIAMETLDDHNNEIKQYKNKRQKSLVQERASSSSPTTRSKKAKPPNISLIEQIISDDRPLEDIISLDILETTPPKNKRHKSQKMQSIPKKKVIKKIKAVKRQSPVLVLKDCSVVLTRQDLSKYTVKVPEESQIESASFEVFEIAESTQVPNIVEDTSGSHLQFDMLDVSEDIVVGDNCEIKSSEDKDAERVEITLNEEVICDNSQSAEPQQADTSQGENICKMYDYANDENLRRDSVTVSGHADAVLAIESVENNFIAACLDGNVYYFNGEGQLLSTLRGSNLAVTCLTIVKEKNGTTVYTGSLDSRIRYYDLETGLEKGPECNVLSPIQTMDRAWDTIFVGTRTGFVLQFECKNNMLIPVSTVKFSDQSILALRAMKEGPRKVLLVAARSEDVTIKDAQTGLLLRTLQGPKMTVYSLLYEDGKIYCGTSSHQIHVFDYASGSHVGVHEGGKGAVCLRATGGLVLAGCYDGCVYVYREGEPRPLAQLRGPSLMLLSLAVVGSKIIAGYKDRSLYIWKIPLSILQEMIL